MNRTVLCTTFAGLFAVASMAPTASAETPDTTAAVVADGADGHADTILARGYPRRYYPRRPAPRRVYVAPRYVPAPRRAAESPYRPVFHMGLGLHGTSVVDDETDTASSAFDTGGGFSVDFGWRVSPSFSLDFGWWMSFHDVGSQVDAAALGAFTVDGRFFLGDWNQRLQPYLLAGLGAYVLTYDDGLDTLSGPGFQLGVGADLYLTRNLSLGGKLVYRGAYVEYDDPYYFDAESSFVSTFSYGADLKFHF